MTGKAKPKKHTAKEIAMKVDAATTNRGGGKAGMADRTGREKGGHAKYECPLCKVTAPDIKSMQIHHDARHPKLPFDEASLVNLHAARVDAESSKPKPGIRGAEVDASGIRTVFLSFEPYRTDDLIRFLKITELPNSYLPEHL
ncbi:zinc finger (C2H2 type) family protein [Citrus sinensis]|uniref:Zinc finger (C2H2 type) family protein n=1 Tax=Citrus sinensis TaxID=2711 RepID=A0ACB8JNR3_CITSI|nr:zinc finger (C2H2 type) family protein [Citrus sinensis]KAH9734439.1 zinc finger (C2H2 type) family protein [Citrus sinensis]